MPVADKQKKHTMKKYLTVPCFLLTIAAALPKVQGDSYDNLTVDIHCRLIGKLDDIIPYENW